MPDWIIACILGIIEGLTEFIPVSSTGHLLLAQQKLPRQTDLFNIVIQSAAVLAVIPLFRNRFHQFLFRWKETAVRDYLWKIIVAFVITGVGGMVLDRLNLKLPEKALPVAFALLIGGILFIAVEQWLKDKPERAEVTWTIAIAVGLAQIVAAVFPGTSRSGASILFALVLGLNRPLATEFSFLVGIPTMLAAGGLKIFKALHTAPHGSGENWSMVIWGSLVSAVISFVAVKWLLRYVQTHTFTGFGWYRIGLAIVILIAARNA